VTHSCDYHRSGSLVPVIKSSMEYYLFIAGKSQGPFDETEIVTAFEEGDIDDTAQIRSVAGGDWMPVRQILPGYDPATLPATPAESAPSVAPPSRRPSLSSDTYLKRLREQSCYQILRTVIDVAAVFAAVSILLWWLTPVAALVLHRHFWIIDPTIGTIPTALVIVINTLVSALAIVVVIGLRQAAFVFIDIADTLLAEHAKSAE
jgi:hypothetical protein